MSRLSERVQKAKNLVFVDIPGVQTSTGGTKGSQDDSYQISLFQKKENEKLIVDNKIMNVTVISSCCEKINPGNGKFNPMEPCPGNQFTVCYHVLGYLRFKLAQRGKQIFFFQDAIAALNGLNFGGELYRVTSKQGNGSFWAVVKDKGHNGIILSVEENINLMRGLADDEGID